MRVWCVGVLLIGFLGVSTSVAEEAYLTEEDMVIKTEGAHRLLLPRDWPVEQRADGVLAPISIEAYLSKKFGQVRAQFETIERQLTALERRLALLRETQGVLEIRMQVLERTVEQGD